MAKKQIGWMLLIALTISFVIIISSLGQAARQESAAQAQQSQTTPTESRASGYVLGIYEEQLAVFREDSAVPYQRLETPASMLSDYDRGQLEQGIVVQTEEELRRLVEDLTS